MKRGAVCVLLIGLIYFLQTTVFTWGAINGIRPNFIIVSITLIAFLRGEYYGLAFGAPLGLLMDIFFGPRLGSNFFLYSCIGLLTGKTYYVFSKENFMFPLLIIALADIGYNLVVYVIGYLFRGNLDFIYFLGRIILPDTIYTVLVGVIFYRLFVFVHQKFLKLEKNQEESELQ